MDKVLRDFVHGDVASAESFGLGLALLLVLALLFLLPAHARPLARQPIVFLLLHAATLAVLRVVPSAEGGRTVALVALFFLLASIGRSAVLLVLDVAIGRRLARPVPRIFRDITQTLVYVAVLLVALRSAGVEPGSILTTSA